MTDQQEIETLLQGIKKYTDFYGYNLERTVKGPNVGKSANATVQRFNAFNAELHIRVDKDGDEWSINMQLADAIGNKHFEKDITGTGPITDISKELHAALKELPPNHKKASDVEEHFLQNFYKGSRYLVEKEYQELFD